jgi:L-amino acid N-acyltransferase YncA
MTGGPRASIREARLSDVRAIARVHIESSQEAYAPLAKQWPAPDLSARAAKWESWLETSQTDPTRVDLVADVEGSIVGFISAGSARRKEAGADVEVYVVHVLPQHRGKSLGSQLWVAANKQARGESLRGMYVDTFAELRCCSFYEAHGGEVVSRTPRVFHGGDVTGVVYAWPLGRSSEPLRVPAG